MTDNKVVYAALKIGAIIIFFNILDRIPSITGLFSYGADASIILALVVTIALNAAIVLVVIAMWFFPVTTARAVGLWSEETEEKSPRYAWLETALLAVIGVYLAVTGLADLAYYLGLHLAILASFGASSQLPADTIGGYAASLVQIALGLALILRSRHIPALLRRLRRI